MPDIAICAFSRIISIVRLQVLIALSAFNAGPLPYISPLALLHLKAIKGFDPTPLYISDIIISLSVTSII